MGIVGSLIPMLVPIFGQGDLKKGYFFAVMAIMLVGYGFMMYGHSTIKERVEPTQGEKVHMKDVFTSLLANKHLFKMLGIFFLNLFMNIVNGIVIYFFTYNMNNENLMTIFGLMGTASALGFFFIPTLTKKFQKRHILSGIVVLDIIVRMIFYFVGYGNPVMLMTMLALTQILHASAGPIMSSMIAETIEYSEVKTGKRCEAITFSGQTFVGKLSTAIAGTVTGIILVMIGYVPEAAEQSVQTLNGLFFVISALPILGGIIRLIILSTYKYNEEAYKNDLAILEQRRLQVSK